MFPVVLGLKKGGPLGHTCSMGNRLGLSNVRRELHPILGYKCIDPGKQDSEAFHVTSVLNVALLRS